MSNKRLKDIISCCPSQSYTQIPNTLLRNPDISFKAKGILCLLLSNRDGWVSYSDALINMGPDGRDSIHGGLRELEKAGYLCRMTYVDAKTKRTVGSFWAYTSHANQFEWELVLTEIESNGFELWSGNAIQPQVEKPYVEKPDTGFPYPANRPLIILNNKKNKNSLSEPSATDEHTSSRRTPVRRSNQQTQPAEEVLPTKPKKQDTTIRYMPFATQLAEVVTNKKKIKINQSKLTAWAKCFKLLHTREGVIPSRIKDALNFYEKFAYCDQYMPVIESGASFKEKFLKLESAMNRYGYKPNQKEEASGKKKFYEMDPHAY